MLQSIECKYEMDLGAPSQELLEWARKELGEDPNTRCEVIANFRDLIYQKGQCNPHRDDDAFLLRFLRARNFVIPRAHRLMVNYCDFRDTNPDLFLDIKLKNILKVADSDLINVPTYRDQKGRRILILKITNWKPEEVSISELFQAQIAMLQAGILEEPTQIKGVVVIFDLEGLTMHQALQMSPSVGKKIVQLAVTCLPVRVEEAHVVNQPWIFKVAFQVMKPFLNDLMKKNLHFHGHKMDTLHQFIEPEFLPKAYGGKRDYQSAAGWMQYFKSNDVIRKEMESLGYDLEDL